VQTDRARLYPPPFPEAGVVGNPDVNPALPAAGFVCNGPPPWNERNGDGVSHFGCYSGATTFAIPQGSTLRLATIHYVVPAGATAGGVTLALTDYPVYGDAGFTAYYCPSDRADERYQLKLLSCDNATVTLLAPATATPSPTATPSATEAAQATATPTTAHQSARSNADSGTTADGANAGATGGAQPVSLAQAAGVVPAATRGPATGVLGASIRPPNAGSGPGAHSNGGTWFGLTLLLGFGGVAAVAATWRRARRA
jgi:hypothetical protein